MLIADSTLHLLDTLMENPEVEEFWVNDLDAVYFAQLGKTQRIAHTLNHDELSLWVERQLMTTHRRLDLSSPFVDATLPDGSRLHVAIADVVRRGWSLNVRKFLRRFNHLEALIASHELDSKTALLLEAAVVNGFNIVIAGGTGAGKTTLLNALLSKVPKAERILTCEEVCELLVENEDWVSMQTRMRGLQGNGEIDLRELIRQALRMRPERLVVGEVRGPECLDLLLAFNSGQPGMATLHANSVSEAVLKLCTLPLLAGSNINADFVVPTVARSVDLIVHVARDSSGIRRITEIGAMTGEVHSGQPMCQSLLRWNGTHWLKVSENFPRTRAHDAIDIQLLWRGL